MTTITIDVSEAVKKLDPKDLEPAITEALHKAGMMLREDMKVYPPPPPNSKYVRTGKLGRSWNTQVKYPRGIIGSYGVSYAPFVQDYDRQAAIHQGRWQTTEMIASKRAHHVKKLVEDVIVRWAR